MERNIALQPFSLPSERQSNQMKGLMLLASNTEVYLLREKHGKSDWKLELLIKRSSLLLDEMQPVVCYPVPQLITAILKALAWRPRGPFCFSLSFKLLQRLFYNYCTVYFGVIYVLFFSKKNKLECRFIYNQVFQAGSCKSLLEIFILNNNMTISLCWAHFVTRAKNAKMAQISPWVIQK